MREPRAGVEKCSGRAAGEPLAERQGRQGRQGRARDYATSFSRGHGAPTIWQPCSHAESKTLAWLLCFVVRLKEEPASSLQFGKDCGFPRDPDLTRCHFLAGHAASGLPRDCNPKMGTYRQVIGIRN